MKIREQPCACFTHRILYQTFVVQGGDGVVLEVAAFLQVLGLALTRGAWHQACDQRATAVAAFVITIRVATKTMTIVKKTGEQR